MTPSWDESMVTGDAIIDEQHRGILGVVDELDAAGEGALASREAQFRLLDEVMQITVGHFLYEEELMDRVGYPPDLMQEMLDQHRDFKSYARLRVVEFRQGRTEAASSLPDFLRGWLVNHEFGLDRKLVDWIRNRAEADRDAVSRA